MNCLTPAQIEHLALEQMFSGSIEHPAHLAACRFCHASFTEMVRFYEQAQTEFQRLSETSMLQALAANVKQNRSFIYKLDALHLLPIQKQIPEYKHTLAADSGVETAVSGTHSVGVFASADKRLMIRILCDPQGEYTLFLIAADKALYANVLVRILGLDREYITDGQGRIHLGKIELPAIEELGVEVRTATDSYDLNQLFVAQNTQIGAGEIILDRADSRQIKLEIIPSGSQYRLKVTIQTDEILPDKEHVRVMVVRENSQPLIQSTFRGVAIFQEIDHPTDLQIKIFE